MNKNEIQAKMRIAMCEEFKPWWYDLLEAYNDPSASRKYGDMLSHLEQNRELSIEDLSSLFPLYDYVIKRIRIKTVREKKLEADKVLSAICELQSEKLGQEDQKAGYDDIKT